MKDSDFIALIYAKVMKDESMWEAVINKVCEEERAKGNHILMRDIVDANNGKLHTIPSVPPTSRCELSSTEYATNNERYGVIDNEKMEQLFQECGPMWGYGDNRIWRMSPEAWKNICAKLKPPEYEDKKEKKE